MPELRKDPIVGRWIIVASERARRPGNFVDPIENKFEEEGPCPFCEHAESKTPPEVHVVRSKNFHSNGPGWKVRVIPSINPILGIEGSLNRRGKGLYDAMDAVGAHEIVVETPEHIANMADLTLTQIELTFEAYIHRIHDLERDPRFKYVMAFKNYGWSAGGSKILHSRSQLIATPVNPMRVKDELVGAKRYFDLHERCVYCDLVHQECASQDRVVSENDHFVSLAPFAARVPFELWIVPKKHSCDFVRGAQGLVHDLAKILKETLLRLKIGLQDPAYNYVVHTAPFRRPNPKGPQWKTIEEDYHWHIEIMPRLTHVAGFEKGTGFYICSIPPESTAGFLREVQIDG